MDRYIIGETKEGYKYITCKKCGMTSYNINDVEHKYCGNCHEFLDMPYIKEESVEELVSKLAGGIPFIFNLICGILIILAGRPFIGIFVILIGTTALTAFKWSNKNDK
jgi:hypothetical protein